MKTIDVDIWLRNAIALIAVITTGLWALALHDVRTLANTNAELAAYITVTMPSAQAAMDALMVSHEQALDALRTRGPGAYEEILAGLVK